MELALRSRLLRSASALALMVTAVPAGAQTAGSRGPAPGPDQVAQRDTTGGAVSASPNAPALGDVPADIVVTGVRASLQSAQQQKRRAPSNIESITAEDLGKFTDPQLTDALARVPGVEVDRNARGLQAGSSVTIRGLASDYVVSTVNGRELLGNPEFGGSGTGRNLDYDSIPPEIITGVTVYKSPTSSIVESGLAGEVDLHTLRPLDYKTAPGKQFFGTVTGAGSYSIDADSVGPRTSGIVGGKFLDGTLGVYIGGVYSSERQTINSLFEDIPSYNFQLNDRNGGSQLFRNVSAVGDVQSVQNNKEITRKALSGDIQWKPTDEVEVNLDFLYSRYDLNLKEVGGSFGAGFNIFQNPTVFAPGGATIRNLGLVSFNTAQQISPPLTFNTINTDTLYVPTTTEQSNFGANAVWRPTDRLQLSTDLSHGNTIYTQNFQSSGVDTNHNLVYGGNFDFSGDVPVITPNGIPANPAVPSNYYAQSLGLYKQQNEFRAERNAVRADAQFTATDNITLKIGSRFASTSTVNQNANVLNLDPTQSGNYPGTVQALQNGPISLVGYPFPLAKYSFSAFCAVNQAACRTNAIGTFPNKLAPASIGRQSSFTVPGLNPDFGLNVGNNSFQVDESTWATYGEIDGNTELFGVGVSGNFGMRAIRVNEYAKAYQTTAFTLNNNGGAIFGTTPPTLVSGKNEYWRALPSANLLVQPTKDINLRAGFASTLSLPGIQALAPAGAAIITVVNPNFAGNLLPNLFNGGNVRLKPTVADNYDLTAEYYTTYGGAYIASLFYKEVRGLNTNLTVNNVTVPGQGQLLFNSTTSINGDLGHARGFELSTNQPFTFLPEPFDGLGFTANYTYVTSSQSVTSAGVTQHFQLPGSSKHNVNATFYYEKDGFGIRVAYNFRTRYLTGISTFAQQLNYVEPIDTVDVTISQKFGEHFEAVLSGTNLAGATQVHTEGDSRFFQQLNDFPTTVTVGLRATF